MPNQNIATENRKYITKIIIFASLTIFAFVIAISLYFITRNKKETEESKQEQLTLPNSDQIQQTENDQTTKNKIEDLNHKNTKNLLLERIIVSAEDHIMQFKIEHVHGLRNERLSDSINANTNNVNQKIISYEEFLHENHHRYYEYNTVFKNSEILDYLKTPYELKFKTINFTNVSLKILTRVEDGIWSNYFIYNDNAPLHFILKKFYPEFEVIEGLLDLKHQNINNAISLYLLTLPDIGTNKNEESDKDIYLYISLEYCPQNLSKNTFEKNNIMAKKILYDVLNGIEYLHRNGFINGGICTKNISLCEKTNNYKLNNTQDIRYINTIDNIFVVFYKQYMYLAPEIYKELKFSQKSDIYSLGILAFFLYNDFEKENLKKLHKFEIKCEDCKMHKFSSIKTGCIKYDENDIKRYYVGNPKCIIDFCLDCKYKSIEFEKYKCTFCWFRQNNGQCQKCSACDFCKYNYFYKRRIELYYMKLAKCDFDKVENEDVKKFIELCCDEDMNTRSSAKDLLENEISIKLFKEFLN